MISFQDARRAPKIDRGIFLRTVWVMFAIFSPLMVITRLSAGASWRGIILSIVSQTSLFIGLVWLGVFLFQGSLAHMVKTRSRWGATAVLYVLLLAAAIFTQIRYSSTYDYIVKQDNPSFFWVVSLAGRTVGIGLAFYYYFYLFERKQAREATARNLALELTSRDAEIDRLRAQINPHFLFNTLTSIAATTTQPEVDEMTQRLADVLRYNLSHAGEHARFEEEVNAIESYLELERLRFGERLRFDLEISRVARETMVSQPVLLPLLENAIKHGFITSPRALRVKIVVSVVSAEFRAVVENSGRWIEPILPAMPGTQIGLHNLKRRLALIYGDRARVERVALPDAVRFTVTLPLDPVA